LDSYGAEQLDIRFPVKAQDVPEDVASSEYHFRSALTFEIGAYEYCWLNRLIGIGVGKSSQTASRRGSCCQQPAMPTEWATTT
jgi:hypothetical protein